MTVFCHTAVWLSLYKKIHQNIKQHSGKYCIMYYHFRLINRTRLKRKYILSKIVINQFDRIQSHDLYPVPAALKQSFTKTNCWPNPTQFQHERITSLVIEEGLCRLYYYDTINSNLLRKFLDSPPIGFPSVYRFESQQSGERWQYFPTYTGSDPAYLSLASGHNGEKPGKARRWRSLVWHPVEAGWRRDMRYFSPARPPMSPASSEARSRVVERSGYFFLTPTKKVYV